jgi:hypothetical protein
MSNRQTVCCGLGIGVTRQIFETTPDDVKVEIYLAPKLVRKHRKLIDALFTWAKEQP